jgi:ubiquinone/menaquinone biosynthesis methyltransferase
MTEFQHRKTRVPGEFDRIAHRYDLLNRLNPGYRKHLRWSAERMSLDSGATVLDLCCGTGLSTEALVGAYPRAQVVGLDASEGMLAVARRKPQLSKVRFVHGDAMDPQAAGLEETFDGILMAYGIRNMPDADQCLGRVMELLKPGGIIAFHEYSVADSMIRKAIWNTVAGTIIIPFGALATKAPDLFRYLRRSVNHFDGVEAFKVRLRKAGFGDICHETMDGWQRGIVHTFLARRPG